MGKVMIQVHGLAKEYRIGSREEKYRTLRDTLADAATAPLRRIKKAFQRNGTHSSNGDNRIWALNDVSFEVERGEIVGVIGANGAGKSTLLKILSRITEPTKGYAKIGGRAASLLEVGTGFHPELTGRENIYLNGAILGMRRAEIDRKFDDILAFAGVEKFCDTPVKYYSSGMYVRLAFAVAAHLEPEILLVDEVLAVGDAAFQKKCIGKIGDIAAEGRTVLFVSHNLGVLRELCASGIVLRNGGVAFRGSIGDALVSYSRTLTEQAPQDETRTGWRYVYINDCMDGSTPQVTAADPLTVRGRLDLHDDCHGGFVFLLVDNCMGQTVVHRRIEIEALCSGPMLAGQHLVTAKLPHLWLAPGMYTLHLKCRTDTLAGRQERHLSDRIVFEVPGSTEGLSRALLAPPCNWELETDAPATASNRYQHSLPMSG